METIPERAIGPMWAITGGIYTDSMMCCAAWPDAHLSNSHDLMQAWQLVHHNAAAPKDHLLKAMFSPTPIDHCAEQQLTQGSPTMSQETGTFAVAALLLTRGPQPHQVEKQFSCSNSGSIMRYTRSITHASAGCAACMGIFWCSFRSCPQAAAASRPRVILMLHGIPRCCRMPWKARAAFLLGRWKSDSSTGFLDTHINVKLETHLSHSL